MCGIESCSLVCCVALVSHCRHMRSAAAVCHVLWWPKSCTHSTSLWVVAVRANNRRSQRTELFEVLSAEAVDSSFSLACWFFHSLLHGSLMPELRPYSEHWICPLVSGISDFWNRESSVTVIICLLRSSSVTVTFLHQCSAVLSKAAGLHRVGTIGGASGLQLTSGHRKHGRNCHIAFTAQIDSGRFNGLKSFSPFWGPTDLLSGPGIVSHCVLLWGQTVSQSVAVSLLTDELP